MTDDPADFDQQYLEIRNRTESKDSLSFIVQGSGSLVSITVAYVPIYPNMQDYVMEQEGYYNDVPAEVTVERFNPGPGVVMAFASAIIYLYQLVL